jgi:hypothetical protein
MLITYSSDLEPTSSTSIMLPVGLRGNRFSEPIANRIFVGSSFPTDYIALIPMTDAYPAPIPIAMPAYASWGCFSKQMDNKIFVAASDLPGTIAIVDLTTLIATPISMPISSVWNAFTAPINEIILIGGGRLATLKDNTRLQLVWDDEVINSIPLSKLEPKYGFTR